MNDRLGEAVTSKDGRFEMRSDAPAFGAFLHESPDVYLDVRLSDGRTHSTRRDLRWQGGHLESVSITVPSAAPSTKDDEGHDHEHDHGDEHDHDHGHDDSSRCGWCGHAHGRHDPCAHPKPPNRCRDVYLKIEKLPAYSPVAPDDAEHHKHRRDCMRNPLHEDATIPNAEVEQRKLDAVVYREHFDAAYTAPLVSSDINEPRFDRRIPGAVIYAEPGERLFIHVLNADDHPHSFHVHGVIYGIDSDGSWPFGVADTEGRRSDAICPGDEWCYIVDAAEDDWSC